MVVVLRHIDLPQKAGIEKLTVLLGRAGSARDAIYAIGRAVVRSLDLRDDQCGEQKVTVDQVIKSPSSWFNRASQKLSTHEATAPQSNVQNQLNPSHDPNGVVWLQNEKSNWRTFDHWDRDNADAISDKTIDLQLPWYQKNPTAVAARVMASAYKMARYDADQSKNGSNHFVSFNQGDIDKYTLKIGVPYITAPAEMTPELQNEWKALCRAYHRANDIIPKETGKTISIQIDTVS
ncbi:hypothetical protein APT_01694 [Acetobacter pasteurianus NBRC 101655]|nr:hypothetical protein APT_01694 [Acetobacter pasteurianus NBRC 101655]